MSDKALIIGIGGNAVRIDAATGTEIWRTKLKGGDLVTVYDEGAIVLAGAGGVLFCLDATTGKILWKNQLKGLGVGLITFMSGGDAAAAVMAKKRAEQAAAAAAAGS